jgi:hypothetical protein
MQWRHHHIATALTFDHIATTITFVFMTLSPMVTWSPGISICTWCNDSIGVEFKIVYCAFNFLQSYLPTWWFVRWVDDATIFFACMMILSLLTCEYWVWLKEHLWNFSVLQRVHLSNTVQSLLPWLTGVESFHELAVAQLVKKFPAIFEILRFLSVFTRTHCRTPFWVTWFQSAPSHPVHLKSFIHVSSGLQLILGTAGITRH